MSNLTISILLPRLDTPFKNFGDPIPRVRGPISPIRQHWDNFTKTLQLNLRMRKHNVDVYEKPLWQFDPEFADNRNSDVTFIPHREKHNFPITKGKAFYYMQTVFPNRFTIDTNGWGGNLSQLPLSTDTSPETEFWFETFRLEYINKNTSKFDQPPAGKFNEEDYYLFICQLPHDETIKYHSNVTVPQALESVLKWGRRNKKKILVKGHPVNPSAMEPLLKLTQEYSDIAKWIDNVSIHDVISKSLGCFTVNSGSGFEVLLHNKPLVIFGNAEYSAAVQTAKPEIKDISLKIEESQDISKYAGLTKNYLDITYDSGDIRSFDKLSV